MAPPQTSPIDSHFVHKTEFSMHSLWLPGGLVPPCRVISNGRKSLYKRHTASTEAYSVKMAALCRYTMVVLYPIVVPHIAHAQTQTVYGRRLNVNIWGCLNA